jgi:hypothetical protein
MAAAVILFVYEIAPVKRSEKAKSYKEVN